MLPLEKTWIPPPSPRFSRASTVHLSKRNCTWAVNSGSSGKGSEVRIKWKKKKETQKKTNKYTGNKLNNKWCQSCSPAVIGWLWTFRLHPTFLINLTQQLYGDSNAHMPPFFYYYYFILFFLFSSSWSINWPPNILKNLFSSLLSPPFTFQVFLLSSSLRTEVLLVLHQ